MFASLFLLVLHLQTMMIDCAHYVAQFIWVIGKNHILSVPNLRYLLNVNGHVASTPCFEHHTLQCNLTTGRQCGVGDRRGLQYSRRGG